MFQARLPTRQLLAQSVGRRCKVIGEGPGYRYSSSIRNINTQTSVQELGLYWTYSLDSDQELVSVVLAHLPRRFLMFLRFRRFIRVIWGFNGDLWVISSLFGLRLSIWVWRSVFSNCTLTFVNSRLQLCSAASNRRSRHRSGVKISP